jgi:hypothetical protein
MKVLRIGFPIIVLFILSVSSYDLSRAENSDVAYQPDAQAEPELLTGEVISLCNYLAKGHLGETHADEGRFLVEDKGLPVAILAQDGQIYVAILKGFKPANEKLAPMLGKKVNVRGVVRRHPGANLIEVQIVSEALD